MDRKWNFIYYQGSCIKEVDDSRRRLLFQITGRFPEARIWISMKLSKIEPAAGNGYYRKLVFQHHFIFHGYELIEGFKHQFSINAVALAAYCQPMHNHIKESMESHYEAERLREKRYNDQKGRY